MEAVLKAEEILLACPKCGGWPMVAIERKLYWSPRLVFKLVCVVCGYQHSNTAKSSSDKSERP
jgi:C4-type Zn-finger protein